MVMTARGIQLAVGLMKQNISFRRNAAAEYERMAQTTDEQRKDFEKGRAKQANHDADQLQGVVDHLNSQLEEMKHEK